MENNQQQQPFAQVLMPPFWQQPQETRVLDSQAVPNVPPVRVEVAFSFVTYMGQRIKPLVAIDGMGNIQAEHPPALSSAERGAFDAACAVMADYFGGQLDMNVLELQRQAGNNFELTKRYPGVVVACPICCGVKVANATCQVCMDQGKVIMVPAQCEGESETAAKTPTKPTRRKQ